MQLNYLLNHLVDLDKEHEKRNLGTFTSIYQSPYTEEYLKYYIHKNFIDKTTYPSLVYLKKVVDSFFKEHYAHTRGDTLTLSGSTESIMMALFLAREKHKLESQITHPNIIVPAHTHYSFYKCANLLGIEVKTAHIADNLAVDINHIANLIDHNTIMIVGVLGSTELGAIDDTRALNELCEKWNIDLHIDAAIGGFIIPFLKTNIKYRFDQLSKLFSTNISGHKFGLSLPGTGILLIRDTNIKNQFCDHLTYLSSGKSQIDSILITSSSTGIFSQAVNILELGNYGYTQLAKSYLETKSHLIQTLNELKIPYISGSEYTPQVFINPNNVEELSTYLKNKKWIQNIYQPKSIYVNPGIRIVVKHNQQELIKSEFTTDLLSYYESTRVEHVMYPTIQI